MEKASFHNEDKIKIIKDGQSSKATYYSHIHTLFSLHTLSLKQQDIMCNMCFLPSTGISARIFTKWLELPTLNEINDLVETGFVQTTTRRTISLHPMIQEITLSETKPSVSSCHNINLFFHVSVPPRSRYNVFYSAGRKIIQLPSQSRVHQESS